MLTRTKAIQRATKVNARTIMKILAARKEEMDLGILGFAGEGVEGRFRAFLRPIGKL